MLEKLKALGESVKQLFLYLIVPLAFVAGYIYHLISKNKDLEGQVQSAKDSEVTKEKINEANQAQKESDNAVDAYRAAFQQYISSRSADLRPSPGEGEQSSGRTGKDDPTKGSGN